MLFTEIITVCYENYMGHINTLCGKNTEWFTVYGTYSNHCVLGR
jgi:hypothetical protein